MTVALRRPWTQQEFFTWAASQDGRWEFDGFQPVAMTGGNANHNRITLNIHVALRSRLRGGPCASFGPDLGISTVGDAIRYPDALVTCTSFPGTERTAPGVVVVFEVLSTESGRRDRIEKVREYAAVPSIRRYVIVESTGIGLTVLERQSADETWRATTLSDDNVLRMPEVGIEVPVVEFYEDVDFPVDSGSGD
jgi:Uma2 family endonuclease